MSDEVEVEIEECLLARECEEAHDAMHKCMEYISGPEMLKVDELGRNLTAVVNACPASNAVKVCAVWMLLRTGIEQMKKHNNPAPGVKQWKN